MWSNHQQPKVKKASGSYLRTRCGGGGGGGWGEDGRWRRLKYPLLVAAAVVVGWFRESLSALTTRRSTRTVVLWTGAESSLTWIFIQRSRLRFPHCNTKSEAVDLGSELALNNDPSSAPPLLSLWLLLLLLMLLLLLLLFFTPSFSISFTLFVHLSHSKTHSWLTLVEAFI